MTRDAITWDEPDPELARLREENALLRDALRDVLTAIDEMESEPGAEPVFAAAWLKEKWAALGCGE